MASNQYHVAIIGSGNWGSTIAKIVGNNAAENDKIATEVRMYVYEEMVNGQKLSEIINTSHENVKYLPGIRLPDNVLAVPSLLETVANADILVFVVPHEFVRGICRQLVGKVKASAFAVSLIKGFDEDGDNIGLISDVIRSMLNMPCAVLMGANLAPEVAQENYCEATIGSSDQTRGLLLKEIFQTRYFRIVVVKDENVVEACGALKNIVAVAAGISDGLGYKDNTKAAVIRLGLMEIIKYCEIYYPGHDQKVFFESCGVADLVTTCYGGRNRKVGEAFARTGKPIAELEKELLGGMKLQGPQTAKEVCIKLQKDGLAERFPLFIAVDEICYSGKEPQLLIERLRNHPEHM